RRHPIHPEVGEERIPAAEIVEHDDPPAVAHELRELFGVERLVGVEEQDPVLGFELLEIDDRRRNDTARTYLCPRETDELTTSLPTRPRDVEGRRVHATNEGKKEENRPLDAAQQEARTAHASRARSCVRRSYQACSRRR